VPNVGQTAGYYADFGLTDLGDGTFATIDGGRQLRIAQAPTRRTAVSASSRPARSPRAKTSVSSSMRGAVISGIGSCVLPLVSPMSLTSP